MAASDTLPIVIAAAIGAGGAVAAQITSAVFTARRERRQLDWEKERQAREWKMREDERFLSLKQELYTNYSLLANQFYDAAKKLTSYYDDKLKSQKPTRPNWKELEKLQSTLQLLAPREVSYSAFEYFSKLLDAVGSAEKNEPTETKVEAANKALEAQLIMNRAMRADLHGPQGHFGRKPGTSVDLPPDPKPAHLLPWWRRAVKSMKGDN